MMKPMKEWTTEEVANWLYCAGFMNGSGGSGGGVDDAADADHDDDDDGETRKKVFALFQSVSGLELQDMPNDKHHDKLVTLIGQDAVEKLLKQIEFTKSIEQYNNSDAVTATTASASASATSTKDLIASLEKVTLEKDQMEKEMALKDEVIAQLQQKVEPDKHFEDELLAMEHRHEVERKRMEERHEREIQATETEVEISRSHSIEHQDEHDSPPDEGLPQLGKRHFKEEPTDLHRFY